MHSRLSGLDHVIWPLQSCSTSTAGEAPHCTFHFRSCGSTATARSFTRSTAVNHCRGPADAQPTFRPRSRDLAVAVLFHIDCRRGPTLYFSLPLLWVHCNCQIIHALHCGEPLQRAG